MGLQLCASFINDGMLSEEAEDFFGDIFHSINQLEDDCLSKIIDTSFEKLKEEEKKFMQAMSVFPAPFAHHSAKQMFPKDCDMMLMRMQQKSLVSKFEDVEARTGRRRAKTIIHPFIRAYCRKLGDFDYYRSKFITIALQNLIEVAFKSHKKDSFAEARDEFVSDLPHYENALKLVCDICRSSRGNNNNNNNNDADYDNDNAASRDSLLRALEKSGILQNLSDVFNFLYHVFSSSQFDLFLVHFLDSLLDLIPKSTAEGVCPQGLSHHVVIKSHKIRSSDFFKQQELNGWIQDADREKENASALAKAHFYYSRGLYTG